MQGFFRLILHLTLKVCSPIDGMAGTRLFHFYIQAQGHTIYRNKLKKFLPPYALEEK